MGRGESHPLQPVDLTAGPQQLGKCSPIPELGPVGVDVLAEQGDLLHTFVDQGLDLGQNLAGASIGLLATQLWHDAEGAGVVAPHGDGHPGRVGTVPMRR